MMKIQMKEKQSQIVTVQAFYCIKAFSDYWAC